MGADLSKLDHLLRLILLIQSGQAGNATQLASTLNVTKRTIHRYLRTLKELNVPCHYDPHQQRYTIGPSFFLPPVQLTFEEALSLCSLAQQAAGRDQVPMLQAAVKAITKIRAVIPGSLQRELAQLESQIHLDLARSIGPDGIADVYTTVQQAIAQRRVLQCSYDAVHGQTDDETSDTLFELSPYSLYFGRRAWYVIGQRSDRQQLRTLKLNRFTSIRLTDIPYMIPDDFDVQQHMGLAWRMVRGNQVHDVLLHFDSQYAETISDTQWHSTQSITYHDDGSIDFACRIAGLDEIVHWILEMGPHCRVIQPPELAQRVYEMAKATVKMYEKDKKKAH